MCSYGGTEQSGGGLIRSLGGGGLQGYGVDGASRSRAMSEPRGMAILSLRFYPNRTNGWRSVTGCNPKSMMSAAPFRGWQRSAALNMD